MDEYEIGEVLPASDGQLYRFKGGDPKDKANWELAEVSAAAAEQAPPVPAKTPQALKQETDRSFVPAFARDAPTYTPEQAKRAIPILAGVASMGIPSVGLLGNMAVNTGVGASLGALAAEPGQRAEGAMVGGGLGLLGGAVAEGGARMIGALQRPGKILALKGEVPALRARVGAQLGAAEQRYGTAEKNVGSLFDTRAQNLEDVHGAMGAGIAERAAERQSLFETTRGSRVADKLRGIAGISDNIDEAMALADRGKDEVRATFYSALDQAPPSTHAPTLQYLRSKELKEAVRAIAPDALKKEGASITFQQLQEIRSRFRSGKFADPAVARRMTSLMNEAYGSELATADQAYATFSQWQRGALEGQKAAAWPASKIRLRLAELPEPAQLGFREGQIAELTQRLRQKGEGAPAFAKFLAGGDEMDERLRTIFPRDEDFRAVKQIVTEERNSLNRILADRDMSVNKLANQKAMAQSELEAERNAAIMRIRGEREATTTGLRSIDERLAGLEDQRALLQQSAERTARRLRQVLRAGAVAAGVGVLGGTAVGLMR